MVGFLRNLGNDNSDVRIQYYFFSSPQCLKMIWKASKSIGNHLFEALMSGSWVDGLAQLGVAVA